ncbi:MAG TPA: hypothetical protein VFC63_19330 [Blastocatellia bacterium]|nr:hypothetical protein [Blastocatellia bacterium]
MYRDLETIANSTPSDYLSYAPQKPEQLATQMMAKARQLFPIPNRDDGVEREQSYSFLFVGPGSGLVVDFLIQQEQIAHGLETSRRGIASAGDTVRNYLIWCKPWETSFPDRFFHVALLHKYLQKLLTPQEWAQTIKEIKRVSKYSSLVG